MKRDNDQLNNTGLIHTGCAEDRRKEFQKLNQGLVLKPGDYVKIGVSEQIDGEVKTEHMWFEVIRVKNRDVFIGRLDNDPVYLKEWQWNKQYIMYFDEIEQILREG